MPDAFRQPKFNMLLARGARLIGPRLAFTVLFEVNAADEPEAKLKAADAVKEVLDSLDRQQPGDQTLPDELDLHEDRIVVVTLAVRRVAGVPDGGATGVSSLGPVPAGGRFGSRPSSCRLPFVGPGAGGARMRTF